MNQNHVTEIVEELTAMWRLLFPGQIPPPDPKQWALWITMHGQTVVRQSIAKLALRCERSNDLQAPESVYKFASALMGKFSNERRTA